MSIEDSFLTFFSLGLLSLVFAREGLVSKNLTLLRSIKSIFKGEGGSVMSLFRHYNLYMY